MRLALVGVLLSTVVFAADGGTPRLEVIHRRDAGVYLVPDEAWNALDTEMKRLQWVEAHPPQYIPPSTEGYLIGMAIVGTTFLLGGIALGFVAGKELK